MIISRQIRKARKSYRCDCGRYIPLGQQYARLYGYAAKPDPPYALQVCMVCDKRAEEAGVYKRPGVPPMSPGRGSA